MPPVAGYFKALRAICDKHDILLVLHEIMRSTGRIGMLHA
jgi:adenosylmethionine-8-amino-7-oxononanoate aminotransferase